MRVASFFYNDVAEYKVLCSAVTEDRIEGRILDSINVYPECIDNPLICGAKFSGELGEITDLRFSEATDEDLELLESLRKRRLASKTRFRKSSEHVVQELVFEMEGEKLVVTQYSTTGDYDEEDVPCLLTSYHEFPLDCSDEDIRNYLKERDRRLSTGGKFVSWTKVFFDDAGVIHEGTLEGGFEKSRGMRLAERFLALAKAA